MEDVGNCFIWFAYLVFWQFYWLYYVILERKKLKKAKKSKESEAAVDESSAPTGEDFTIQPEKVTPRIDTSK